MSRTQRLFIAGAAVLLVAATLPAAASTGPVTAAAAPPAAVPQEPLPLEQLVARVQARYRGLVDLQARLRQVKTPRAGAATRTEEGDWFVRTPGLLRVEYDRTRHLLVVDDEAVYWYLPEDNQVQVFDQRAVDPTYTPTLYLAGAGSLLDDFRVAGAQWEAPLAPGNVQIRLEPRREEANFDHLILEVDPTTSLIARLVQFGLLGETTDFQFTDIRTDVGLPDELFEFEFPAGVQVEHLGR